MRGPAASVIPVGIEEGEQGEHGDEPDQDDDYCEGPRLLEVSVIIIRESTYQVILMLG